MAIEVRTQVRRQRGSVQLPSVDDVFLRRDYEKVFESNVPLAAGVRTEVRTGIGDIEFLYVSCEDEVVINIYRNLSPEWWEFSRAWFALEVTNCDRISFKAASDTEIYVYAAGSTS